MKYMQMKSRHVAVTDADPRTMDLYNTASIYRSMAVHAELCVDRAAI